MKRATIYPSEKMALRFSLIIGLGFGAALIRCGFDIAVASFAIFTLIVLLLAYSYRISVTEKTVRFYQFFIPLLPIYIDSIRDIYYATFARNGQGSAIVITIESGKEKIYPVRLFDMDAVNGLISEIRERNSITSPPHFAASQSAFFGKIHIPRKGVLKLFAVTGIILTFAVLMHFAFRAP